VERSPWEVAVRAEAPRRGCGASVRAGDFGSGALRLFRLYGSRWGMDWYPRTANHQRSVGLRRATRRREEIPSEQCWRIGTQGGRWFPRVLGMCCDTAPHIRNAFRLCTLPDWAYPQGMAVYELTVDGKLRTIHADGYRTENGATVFWETFHDTITKATTRVVLRVHVDEDSVLKLPPRP
jgi:hypothetical protein